MGERIIIYESDEELRSRLQIAREVNKAVTAIEDATNTKIINKQSVVYLDMKLNIQFHLRHMKH